MTEPKRWSSPSSEVDPVLRSVLLYGRHLAPNSQQLQAILRGSERRRPAPQRRRFLAFVLAGAAAACAGVAFAGYAGGLLFDSTPSAPTLPRAALPAASRPSASRASASRPSANPAGASAPTANPAAASGPPADPSSASPLLTVPPSLTPAASREPPATRAELSGPRGAPSASPASEQDAALLQQAQRLVAVEPARALSIIRDHEVHFPSSPLSEERQALRIEALARLGRRSEATRDLSAFDQHFPHSIYRHRLHVLLPE